MFNILKSYWMRTKRTPSRAVLFACPLLFTCLFSIYISISSSLKGLEVAYYFLAYIILACFSISFFIPMLYESDKKAALYANDFRCGINRKKLFFARFIFISILLILIELIAVFPFLLFLYFYGITINFLDIVSYIFICLVSLMPMIPFYQYLTMKFNYSGTILAGAILTLAAILLGTTNLGEGIWYYLPFVYPVKFTVLYAERLCSTNEIFIILILSLLLSMLSLIGFSLWYNRWDGISQMEE